MYYVCSAFAARGSGSQWHASEAVSGGRRLTGFLALSGRVVTGRYIEIARQIAKRFSRRILVECRLLDVVDDENVRRSFGRFQLEPELLLERAKERRCITIPRAWRHVFVFGDGLGGLVLGRTTFRILTALVESSDDAVTTHEAFQEMHEVTSRPDIDFANLRCTDKKALTIANRGYPGFGWHGLTRPMSMCH